MKKEEKIKGVIFFDLDDTLFLTSKFAENARNRAFEKIIKLDKSLTKEILKKEFHKVYMKYGSNYGKHFDEIFKNLKIEDKNTLEKYVAICVLEYHKYKSKIKKYLPNDIIKLLKKLKKNNFILGIITIGIGKKQWDKIYRLELDKFFDQENTYISSIHNFTKDEQFYKKIFEKYSKKYSTKNIWMIGDREDGDIIAAKKANLKTIRIKQGKRIGDFENSIADYKVEKFKEIEKILL